jgi:hypothetical protein
MMIRDKDFGKGQDNGGLDMAMYYKVMTAVQRLGGRFTAEGQNAFEPSKVAEYLRGVGIDKIDNDIFNQLQWRDPPFESLEELTTELQKVLMPLAYPNGMPGGSHGGEHGGEHGGSHGGPGEK